MLHQRNAIRQCRQSLTDLEDRRDKYHHLQLDAHLEHVLKHTKMDF